MQTAIKQLQEFFVIYNKKLCKYLGDSNPYNWVDDYLNLQQDLFKTQKVMKLKTIEAAKYVFSRMESKKDCYVKRILVRTTIETEEELI